MWYVPTKLVFTIDTFLKIYIGSSEYICFSFFLSPGVSRYQLPQITDPLSIYAVTFTELFLVDVSVRKIKSPQVLKRE